MSDRLKARYSPSARILHWVTAMLVLIAFIVGPEGSEQQIYDTSRDFGLQLHETLGLAVLGLTVVRVLWRVIDSQPEPIEVERWMGIASKVVQGLLYILLFAVPLSAIAGAWFEGHPLTLLASIKIMPAIATSRSVGKTIAEIHTWLGDAILWLAGFHALAALFHHYILKDGILVSMLPRWRR